MAYRRVTRRRAQRRQQSAGARPPTRGRRGPTPEGGRRQAWTRLARSRVDAVASRLSSPAAGALAAIWSAVISLLAITGIVVMAWILGAGEGSATTVLRVGALGWVATHHVVLSLPTGVFSALPIGIAAIPGVLLYRAGKWAARRSGACRWQDVRVTVGVAAAVYGTAGMFIAGFGSIDQASVEPLYALFGCGFFALLAFGAGTIREADLWPTVAARLPTRTRRACRSAAIAWLTLTTAAALSLGISLIFHFGLAITMSKSLDGGFMGGLLLFVVGVTYLPNAVIWTISYLCGVGFSIGDTTAVSPFRVDGGALPAFPLMAAVPGTAPLWAPLLLMAPMIAGGLAALVLNRGVPGQLLSLAALRERLWMAGLAGAAVALASFLAAGGLGGHRLAHVGPSALAAGLAAFGLILAGAWLTDALRSLKDRLISQDRVVDIRVRFKRARAAAADGEELRP